MSKLTIAEIRESVIEDHERILAELATKRQARNVLNAEIRELVDAEVEAGRLRRQFTKNDA